MVVDPAADELTGDGEEEAQDNEDVRDKLRKALQRLNVSHILFRMFVLCAFRSRCQHHRKPESRPM